MMSSYSLMALNAHLTVLACCAFALFIYYIWQNKLEGYEFLRAAIALLVLWIGDIFLRGPIWFTRQLVNIGVPTQPSETWLYLGGGITVLAYLCIIRVFSPKRWGHRVWIISFMLANAFTAASLLFTYWENSR